MRVVEGRHTSISESKVFLLDVEKFSTNGKGHDRELIDCDCFREDVALLSWVDFGAGNGGVDCFAGFVVDESKGSS